MTASNTPGGTSRSRYAPVLEQCRDLVSGFAATRLSDLFKQAGSALLDFADRAESNAVQGRFFEAMRQLQRRSADIEQIFYQELNEGFKTFAAAGIVSPDDDDELSTDGAGGVELSLVEPDDMEESVATENLIARANAEYFPTLYAISQRLAVVAGRRKLKDQEIPAGPHHLVHSFRRAMEGLDVEIKVKVILYALYDKLVLKQCGDVYEQYNTLLKSAGILPKLKRAFVRAASERRAEPRAEEPSHDESIGGQTQRIAGGEPRGTAGGNLSGQGFDTSDAPVQPAGDQPPMDATPSGGGEPTDLGTELLHSILDLMTVRRPMPGRGGSRAESGGWGYNRTAATQEVGTRAKTEILAALTQAQAKVAAEVQAHGAVRGSTDATARLATTGTGTGYGAYSGLQEDATFLERARATLAADRHKIMEQVKSEDLSPVDANLIDLIGMLFEYMLNDPVLPNAAKALLSHLHTPYLKVALIDRQLLEKKTHPARRLLDEMVEAGSVLIDESNLAKGIFPHMQKTVDQVLREFTDDVGLFGDLLQRFRTAVQDLQRRTATVEQRAQAAARGREQLILARQRASQHIRTLTARHPIPEALADFLHTIWEDQLVFVLLRERDGDESPAWRSANASAEELVALFDPDASADQRRTRIERAPKLRDGILREVQRMGSYNRAALDALAKLLDNPMAWKPPVQAAAEAGAGSAKLQTRPAETTAGTESFAPGPSSEMMEQLRQMRVGTWLEFRPQPDSAPRRLKLSWVSPLTSTCMFVDRAGTQAEVKTLRDLADEIDSGRAKIIPRPKHPFIERALLSIRKLLQTDDGDTKAPATA